MVFYTYFTLIVVLSVGMLLTRVRDKFEQPKEVRNKNYTDEKREVKRKICAGLFWGKIREAGRVIMFL